MITNLGKTTIKNFFGGVTPLIGGSIAVGVGSTAASLTDTGLAFEACRLGVVTVSPDLVNNRIVFKGVLPAGKIGKIYEIGLYHLGTSDTSRLLSLTNQLSTTSWSNASIAASNGRINGNSVQITAASGATTTASLSPTSYNLAQYTSSDSVMMAVTTDANLASLSLRLGTNATNYNQYAITPLSAGYNTVRVSLGSAVTTGVVDMSNISYVAIVATATSGGSTNVYVDDVRVDHPQDDLVSRYVLSSPQVVDSSIPTEIEYSLGISV
jgi:hypothetical protein